MPYNVILCQTPSFLGDLQNTLIPYHGEIGHCLVYFYRYIEPPVSLNFCILVFFFLNGLQPLYVNPSCLKCF